MINNLLEKVNTAIEKRASLDANSRAQTLGNTIPMMNQTNKFN